jgi:hypothetical protein
MIEMFFVICMYAQPTVCEEHSVGTGNAYQMAIGNISQADMIPHIRPGWHLVRYGARRIKDDP